MAEARKQSRLNWRTEYTTQAAVQYFRDGFQKVGTDGNLPPNVGVITHNATDVDLATSGLQIKEGTRVTFSGSATDPEGKPLTWEWLYTVDGGAEISFVSGTNMPVAIPEVGFSYGIGTAGQRYRWTLRVDDGEFRRTSTLAVDVVANVAPTANAGHDQNVFLPGNATTVIVNLDASRSDDVDGTLAAYRWSGMPDPPDIASPAVALGKGTHVFSLEVVDDRGATATDSVTITVSPPAAIQFGDVPYFGDFNNYIPLTSSRWEVASDAGNDRLYLNASTFSPINGDRLGEYALINDRSYGDLTITFQARTAEDLESNSAADYAIVFGYIDDNNYSYVLMNSNASSTGLEKVIDGHKTTVFHPNLVTIPDMAYHNVQLSRTGTTVTVLLDGVEVISATDPDLALGGLIGVGAFNDSVYFDNISAMGTPRIAGDMDLDGNRDFDDVNTFVIAFRDPAVYESIYSVPPTLNGDYDNDRDVDVDDLVAFSNSFRGSADYPAVVDSLATLIDDDDGDGDVDFDDIPFLRSPWSDLLGPD